MDISENRKNILDCIIGEVRPDVVLYIDRQLAEIYNEGNLPVPEDKSCVEEFEVNGTKVYINASTLDGVGPFWYELSNSTCEYSSLDMGIPKGFPNTHVCKQKAIAFLEEADRIQEIIMKGTIK